MTKACPALGAKEGGLKYEYVLANKRVGPNIRTWGFV